MLDKLKMKISVKQPNVSSIMIKDEYVCSILEYGIGQILLGTQHADLLLIKNWKFIAKISDSNPNNFQKYWLAPIPFFNSETFPFIVSSGYETIDLINVKDFS